MSPSASTSAPAASQEPLIFTTYNPGGNDENAFQSKHDAFAAKLETDLRALVARDCDVIMLQEVAHQWRDVVKDTLVGWEVFESKACNNVTAIKAWKSGWRLVHCEDKKVFSAYEDRQNVYRWWRTYLEVRAIFNCALELSSCVQVRR